MWKNFGILNSHSYMSHFIYHVANGNYNSNNDSCLLSPYCVTGTVLSVSQSLPYLILIETFKVAPTLSIFLARKTG